MEQSSQTQERRPRHHQGGRGRGRGRRRGGGSGSDSAPPSTTDAQQSHGRQPRRPPRSEQPAPSDEPATTSTAPARPSRRERFKATLTQASEPQAPAPPVPSSSDKPKPRSPHKPARRPREPPGDDLTSTLTRALRTPPYPDCPICFNPIRPDQSTWSCSPSTSTEANADGAQTDVCWSTFHLKCIRAWAEKSVKELEEAWRARGESKPGEWRCPGCRATRRAVPQTYMCFCLRMRNPAPPRIATPHSCAQPCSRPRSACGHACPLPCHPGPCPPCAVTIQVTCFCGKETHSAKCQVGAVTLLFKCTRPCRKTLSCGNSEHRCADQCHEGPCLPCPVREDIRCWCGRQTKQVACSEVKDSTKCVLVKDDGTEEEWMGSYGCGHPCERPFACSYHSCTKICHPPSRTPPPCPFDPERVLSCACGRRRVARSSDELFPSLLPPRTSCTSPLPTCTSPCSKLLPCGHQCKATCHWDSCPPCTESVERTCRCGATKHKTPCSDAISTLTTSDDSTPASDAILCDKPCQAQRLCGRHQCGRVCCPLAHVAQLQRVAAKSSKRTDADATLLHHQLQLLTLDAATRALHECDLPCGRALTCGNHRCPRGDHKGPCETCPRGVFEELVCPCGRTVLEPPIRCGTRLRCVYPCARPAPACGHPHVPHVCHEGVVVAGADTADEGLGLGGEAGEDRGCPPCPFLTEKVCACGKKQVGNVRCSQERVSCGSVCGKLLACGFHHCERPCHADECGTCTAVCGKARKSCLPANHPCTQTCHAPAACPENEPCHAPVTIACPCGNLRSTVPCSGTKLVLACSGECEIKKRNARLAEALGISEEKRETRGKVTWAGDLVGTARTLGPRFLGLVEKAFADFIASSRSTRVLPHMPPDRRKFVHDLASVYRMDTIMVDQEPHRSVQLIRRIDTRVPTPLLSQQIASTVGRSVDPRSVGRGVAGASGWSTVAKTGLSVASVAVSGGSTPAPVRTPSPGDVAVGRSREASPGPSQFAGTSAIGVGAVGTKSGVWVSPSVRVQRERERERSVIATTSSGTGPVVEVPPGTASGADVPDDWEDDA